MIHKKAIVIGAAAGLVLAAIDVGAIRLNQGRHPTVEEITNLVGALPVFLFWSASVPEILSIALFFIYWALCGAVLAALAARKRLLSAITALLLFAALGIAHRAAQLALNQEMEEAARAHGHGMGAKPTHP